MTSKSRTHSNVKHTFKSSGTSHHIISFFMSHKHFSITIMSVFF